MNFNANNEHSIAVSLSIYKLIKKFYSLRTEFEQRELF